MSNQAGEPTQMQGGSASPTMKQRLSSFINFDFTRNILFYFKCAFIALSIAGAIAAGWRYETASQTRFFHFVAVMCIIVSLTITCFYFLNVMAKFTRVPWVIVQLAIDAFFILFYIIASAVCVDAARRYSNFDHLAAAAFFGFALVLLHILEAIYFLIQWKRGNFYFSSTTTSTQANTQGGVTTTTTRTVVSKQSEQIVY